MKQIEISLRRARVKNYLLKGKNIEEIAELEECAEGTISKDVKAIGKDAFLAKTEESATLIFEALVEEVVWAVEEAKVIHKNTKSFNEGSGEHSGGRMDALKYITEENRKLIDVAQQLGLLDTIAKKVEVTEHPYIPADKVKEYGDWLAQHMTEE